MKPIRKNDPSSTIQVKTAPKIFAWLAAVTTVLLIIASQFLPRGDHQTLRIGGVVMLLTAAVFIFTPFYLLSKYGETQAGKTYLQAREVVQQSLYALLRHPQYLGYMLLACGFTLLSQHWVAMLLASLSVIFFYMQAVQEERHCLDLYGESYRRYLQRVPRFNFIQGIWRNLRGKNND
jgi:protein-S-isoprenylcysteine O-methyltransferase Ste14